MNTVPFVAFKEYLRYEYYSTVLQSLGPYIEREGLLNAHLRYKANIFHKKINLKWIKDLEIWFETIKYTKENKGRTLQNLDLKCVSNDLIPLAKATKLKINKWGYIELKNF